MLTYRDIKKEAYEGDNNCCTVISASLIFNKNYQETRSFFALNGRKNGRGLTWSKYNRIMDRLAKLEGYTIKKFDVMAWDIEAGKQTFAFVDKSSKNVDTIIKDLKTKTAVTTNNFRKYLPSGNYVFSMSGHVATCLNGTLQDWTNGRAKRITNIWQVEKTGKKVKTRNFSKYEDVDFSDFI